MQRFDTGKRVGCPPNHRLSQEGRDPLTTLAPDLSELPTGVEETAVGGRSPWQLFWGRFREDKLAFVGLGIIVFMIVLALFAPVIATATGHGPNDLFQSQTLDSFGLPKQGPSGSFLFGADQSGRDVFVRIAYGARISLLVGLVATAIAVVVGTVLGVLAGYRGGWIDTMISRGVDILVSMPLIIFGIGIVAACSGQQGCLNGQLHPGLPLVIVIVALFSWPYVARLVRGQTLSLREKEFVEASRSLGMSEIGIMFREILPNLVAPLIVYSSLLIPSNILFEAYLAFLGLGLPSTTPSWGRMLSDATDLLDTAWWLWLFPGLFLVLTVLAFNLLGDGLRDALDPRTGR